MTPAQEPDTLHVANPLDWSLFDFSHLIPPEVTPSGDQWGHELQDALPDPPSNTSSVRQLADLNVQLYEHSKTLPPLHVSFADLPLFTEGRLFAIDDTFKMTQSLVTLIQHLYTDTDVNDSHPIPDQGTALLVLSCANRVFDIYDNILHHMRECIQHCTAPVYADGKSIVLPPLRIGSFSPPKTTTVTMHMLMVVVMASGLFDQLQEALGICHQIGGSGSGGGCLGVEVGVNLGSGTNARRRFPDFAEEAREEVLVRARAVAGDIRSTRVLLLESPGIRG